MELKIILALVVVIIAITHKWIKAEKVITKLNDELINQTQLIFSHMYQRDMARCDLNRFKIELKEIMEAFQNDTLKANEIEERKW